MCVNAHSIPIAKIRQSPWNFNELSEDEINDLALNLERNGIINKIVLRLIGDYYEIVDGEHKIKALKVLGRDSVSLDDVDIREISDAEARQYIRSSLTRGRRVDPIKEAEHYLDDFEEAKATNENLSLSNYADGIGVERTKLTRILNRNKLTPLVKDYISKAENLSPTVIDEIVTKGGGPNIFKIAEEEGWTQKETREKLKKGMGLDGLLVKTKDYPKMQKSEVHNLSYKERFAVFKILESLALNLYKVSDYIGEKNLPKYTGELQSASRKLESLKDKIAGKYTYTDPEGKKRDKDELFEWMSINPSLAHDTTKPIIEHIIYG